MAALADVLGSDDVIGIVARETRVRLVNISVSGCLLESAHRIEHGTTGMLEVVVGAEFLWTSHPGSWSLRRMVSRLRKNMAQQAVRVAFVAGRVM